MTRMTSLKHRDQYTFNDFDYLFAVIGPAFNEMSIYYVENKKRKQRPATEIETQDILKKINIENALFAFNHVYMILSKKITSTKDNPICKGRECDKNCGFIPKYPNLTIRLSDGKPINGWIKV